MAFSSALVQEGVSRVSSYISTKLEDNVSNAHLVARLEMALSQLEFSLERTASLPITYISLLRRRKMLKQAYMEGTDLLNKHKLQLLTHEPQEQLTDDAVRRAVTHSSFPMLERIFGGARNLSISSLLGLSQEYLSPSIVQIFERYADCADKFVTDMESGCRLQHDTFRYPFERKLLEGKTLVYTMVKGSQSRRICMLPVCSEARGIEVELSYCYEDGKMPAKHFFMAVNLRLSQGTDIIGTAIRSLQFVTESLKLLTSQFKCVAESALGEITMISSLHDFSHSGHPRFLGPSHETVAEHNRRCRPDPICCTNNFVSSESSNGVPEPVIDFYFDCRILAPEVVGTSAPVLRLQIVCMPHKSSPGPKLIGVKFENKLECISGGSMQLMEELLRSKALDCLSRHPEPAKYDVYWYTPHGGAIMSLEKSEMACLKPTLFRRSSRIAGKRKR